MSKPLLIANWKNHPESLARGTNILQGFSKKQSLFKKTSLFIAPPLPYFETVSKKIKNYATLAAQDIFFTSEGTHTGVVTPEILKSFGVKLSIIGHSERRALGETNEVVAQKVKTSLLSNITPVLCVGETTRDTEGDHFGFLQEQLKLSLEGIRRKDDAERLIIAYEPVWAIGKTAKDAMQPSDLSQMIIFIKKVLTEIFDRESADKIPIIYGGSVEPENAKQLFDTDIRGFLVGHASLDPQSFATIAEAIV
ncbi:triose-phosphate isomerase [Candidatus Parcubacteria bacterium]|nr:triose-phosphate isomerase [Candidatus Parcubacteria bacterium]